jgi:hypothetical protein
LFPAALLTHRVERKGGGEDQRKIPLDNRESALEHPR